MDPFKEFTHGGTLNVAEILFNTRFDYLFPLLAANKECLLPTRTDHSRRAPVARKGDGR